MATSTTTFKMAYTRAEAADAIGLSIDVINRAVRSGDLREDRPVIEGRTLSKGVILAAELERWITGGAR